MTSRTRIRFSVFILFSVSCFFYACGNQPTEPANNGDRIQLENDEATLSAQITYVNKTIPVEFSTRKTGASYLSQTVPFQLKLRAEVSPPIVDGQFLHASHVTFDDSHAYVSYSTAQNQYRGAVEIVDVVNPEHPILLSQALFLDTDITIATAFAGKLFLGEATASDRNPVFDTPACLEILDLQANRLTDNSQRFDLPSFNANDVACFDNSVFVTSGTTNGALSVFKQHALSLEKQIPLEGAKAIDKTDSYVLVLEGTGTNLHLFDRSTLTFIKTISLGCDNFLQEKAEMAVDGDNVYLSAFRCGVLVVDLKNETVATAIPAPTGGQTNGVSVANGRLFMANGSDGLMIGKITLAGIVSLGKATFEGSTNFVASKDNLVFVANGVGGLKILEIVEPVAPITVSVESVVLADGGESGSSDLHVAEVDIKTRGKYRIDTTVWYNSGDEQKNESFYLELQDESGNKTKPLNPNAGGYKVVPDDPGEPHTVMRDSGTFPFSPGKYFINVYHYAKIANQYPQFINGSINGAESVHIKGFTIEYVDR